MDVRKRLNLLVIGKTGHGKSATGNSILGKKDVFDTNNSTSSVRKHPQCEQIMFEGRAIHVVDTHSDTSKDKSLVDAIAACRQGFHAILFVVKYGCRFTEQDEEAIEMLKELFGNCFLRDHGIIIMCNGDSFKRETREPTLESYCNNVTGPFKQLLDECGNRIVLFDNTTKDESEKHQQVKKLVEMVHRLTNNGKRYLNKYFEKAAENSKPTNKKEIQEFILEEMRRSDYVQEEKSTTLLLEHLLPQIDSFNNNLKENDQDTRVLYELVDDVIQTRDDVTHKRIQAQKEIEGNKKIKKGKNIKENEGLNQNKAEDEKRAHEEIRRREMQLQHSAKEEKREQKNCEKEIEKQMKCNEKEKKRKELIEKNKAEEEVDKTQADIERENVKSKKELEEKRVKESQELETKMTEEEKQVQEERKNELEMQLLAIEEPERERKIFQTKIEEIRKHYEKDKKRM